MEGIIYKNNESLNVAQYYNEKFNSVLKFIGYPENLISESKNPRRSPTRNEAKTKFHYLRLPLTCNRVPSTIYTKESMNI